MSYNGYRPEIISPWGLANKPMPTASDAGARPYCTISVTMGVFSVIDTVRFLLVQGNTRVRTCSWVQRCGKLMIGPMKSILVAKRVTLGHYRVKVNISFYWFMICDPGLVSKAGMQAMGSLWINLVINQLRPLLVKTFIFWFGAPLNSIFQKKT